MKTVMIDGEKYVRESDISGETMATKVDGMPFMMVRTYSAGVFAGYVEKLEGRHAVLRKARRIWYWDGAASLSELAVKGTSKPENCKFPCEVERVELTEVIEMIDITAAAKRSIESVPVWTAHK